ncbi:MAG: hypothetical protein ACYDH3_00225 [Candidatus Aminicenantales bacterium]
MKNSLRKLSALVLLALLTLGMAGAATAPRIAYGWLCWSDDATMLSRDSASGAWTIHIEPVRQYLCAIANAGADEVRVLPYGVWGPRPDGILSQFSPYVVNGGKFNLAEFNDYYFPIMRRFIEAANEYGLRVRFVWFDNCQLAGNYKNPWETNGQGITSFYGKPADKYSRPWIRRVVQEFTGLDVSYALGNETTDPEFVGMADRVLIPAVRELGLNPSRLYFGATMSRVAWQGTGYDIHAPPTVQDLVRSHFAGEFGDSFGHKIAREVHGCGVGIDPGSLAHQALWWWAGKPVGPFELSDDGEWAGASKCDREDAGHVRPSAEQWTATIKASLCKNINYEHLPKGGDLACQVAVLRAMYRAIYDRWPTEQYVYAPLIQMVQVAVCPDSGLLPNKYCPATELREFEQGHEPTEVCGIHKAKDCGCGGWFWRGDFRRWWDCVFGDGPKWCK